jgi:hypothetical protein
MKDYMRLSYQTLQTPISKMRQLFLSINNELCCNEFDLDFRAGCLGDLFQSSERKAVIFAALDTRNRLLAGSHELRHLLAIRQERAGGLQDSILSEWVLMLE